ncbi:glutamate--cysteine ligase [Planotetraspora phitsanulokensis]|uniref:Putative glutamate--cysteine ligase 2 n=1 Tax=Planotetraspora phitsanulokensis TaxID=575192 RepID=A0A8J3XF56_9ACTN|nr:glutamate--cysteine ligase [Planotetraspora phitsanulokensis]GII39262.1 putative glutamate--cysteine ligase 2-3 [Planotetraspora phitsanulokensis]
MGVEEEFLLLDPETGRVVPGAEAVRGRVRGPIATRLVPELTRFQVESNTEVHTDLHHLGDDLLELRRAAAAAAAQSGLGLVACGTALSGNGGVPPLSRSPRYHDIAREFRAVIRGQGVCGCHVHIGMDDHEEAVQVSNHARPWLPVLLALTVNSPIADELDTGYASWRTMLIGRWPSAEPSPFFHSFAHYESLVAGLRASGAIMDRGMVYWLIRISDHVPTLEFRAADVCATVGETVLLAALVRALAATALLDVREGRAAPQIDQTLLRAAYWRAARDGMEGHGLDLLTGSRVPAWRLVRGLLDRIRPSLVATGDLRMVTAALDAIRRGGSGAARQRAVYLRRRHLPDVARLLIEQTVAAPGRRAL